MNLQDAAQGIDATTPKILTSVMSLVFCNALGGCDKSLASDLSQNFRDTFVPQILEAPVFDQSLFETPPTSSPS